MLRSPVLGPLRVGSFTDLSLWVHDPKTTSTGVIFNPEYWPGIAEGDYVRVTEVVGDEDGNVVWEKDGFLRDGFLFMVKPPPDDTRLSNTLQVSMYLLF